MNLTIGEKIALLRKEKNITQTELAEYLFLTPQTVSRWEVGNGAPDVALLPKIAMFFNVSIDELFGMTSMERVEDLVCKYSVLRDDRSFREAMDCIDSQLQTIAAALKNGTEDRAALERDRDQLEVEKIHMWIQQGREAFRRALQMADAFVEKTEGDPDHPWYLRMRMQRDQLCLHVGRGRETLAERKRELAEHPDAGTLQRFFQLLSHLQDYEGLLSIQETDASVRDILFPPAENTMDAWLPLIEAAAKTGRTDLVEQWLPPLLEVCSKDEMFDLLRDVRDLYHGEKRAAINEHLLSLVPQVFSNKYFAEKVRQMIEQD